MKICFSLITCKLLKYRIELARKTWAKKLKTGEDLLLFGAHNDKNVIKVAKRDCYKSAVEKTLGCIKYLNKKTNFDAYFFGDDDTYFFLENIYEFLKINNNIFLSSEPVLYCNKKKLGLPVPFPHGGSGMVFNRAAIEKAATNIKGCPRHHVHSDCTLGFLMDRSKIKLTPSNFSDGKRPTNFSKHLAVHLEHKANEFEKMYIREQKYRIKKL